jgi:HK97 family phage major capsid protein
MNIQQQIKSYLDLRETKSAVISSLLEASEKSGESFDPEQATQYDEAKAEVATIDKHLDRLRESELLLGKNAKPIQSPTQDDEGSVVTLKEGPSDHRRIVAVERKLEKGIGFARFVGLMARGNGDASVALQMAKEMYPNETPLQNVIKMHIGQGSSRAFIEKTAVAGAITSTAAFAGALVQYQDLATDFIEYLRPKTIIGRLPGMRMVPFKVRVKRQTGGATASWVGEGKAKPLSNAAFDTVTLDFTKLAAITVVTDEVARLSVPSADTLLRDDLANAVITTMDSDFIDPSNSGSSNVKPASITNGATNSAATGTTTYSAIATDILTLFAPWIAANIDPTGGAWIMSPTTAMALSLMLTSLGNRQFPTIDMTGGTLEGLPVIVSQSAGLVGASDGSHIVVLVHAPSILLADDGMVAVDASREASVEMSDAPTNQSANGTGASLVSMWQTNSTAIRAERWVNWVKGRSAAVSYLTAVHWGGFPV